MERLEHMSDSECSDSSESNGNSSSSESSESIHSGQMAVATEPARILKETLELPKGLCEDDRIFSEFFSLNTLHQLGPQMQSHLQQFLPTFSEDPREDSLEKQRTLYGLFSDELERFGSTPLSDLQRNLEDGNYRPEIARFRAHIQKSQRREQRFQECERISRVAKSMMVARDKLLQFAYDSPASTSFSSSNRYSYANGVAATGAPLTSTVATQRSKKRYFNDIASIAAEAGLRDEVLTDDESYPGEPSCHMTRKQRRQLNGMQGGAMSPGSESRVQSTTAPRGGCLDHLVDAGGSFSLSDDFYRQSIYQHKKRKIDEPDHPELMTKDVELVDILGRTHLSASVRRALLQYKPPVKKIKIKQESLSQPTISLPAFVQPPEPFVHQTKVEHPSVVPIQTIPPNVCPSAIQSPPAATVETYPASLIYTPTTYSYVHTSPPIAQLAVSTSSNMCDTSHPSTVFQHSSPTPISFHKKLPAPTSSIQQELFADQSPNFHSESESEDASPIKSERLSPPPTSISLANPHQPDRCSPEPQKLLSTLRSQLTPSSSKLIISVSGNGQMASVPTPSPQPHIQIIDRPPSPITMVKKEVFTIVAEPQPPSTVFQVKSEPPPPTVSMHLAPIPTSIHMPTSVPATIHVSTLVAPSIHLPQYGGTVKAATLSDLEGIDMMHLPVDLDDSGDIGILNEMSVEDVEIEIENKPAEPEPMADTHSSFFALIREIFCSTPNHRTTIDHLHERISGWLANPITALNDWYVEAENWLTQIPSAIQFMAGDFHELPEDFVPYVEYKPQLCIYQWIGAGRDSDQHLNPLCDFWLQRRNEVANSMTTPPATTPDVQTRSSTKSSVTEGEDSESGSNLERPTSPLPPRCPTAWTVAKANDSEVELFREQERTRFENPHLSFTYRLHGFESVVGPVKGIYTQIPVLTKARGHTMLTVDRPSFVTILTLVRDATARLPNGEGTRTDICQLLRSSQYINQDAADNVLQTIVSGALDRMHTEHDPCVRYDPKRKIWIYLHRNRSEEEFERMHQQFQGVSKHKKQSNRKIKGKSIIKSPIEVQQLPPHSSVSPVTPKSSVAPSMVQSPAKMVSASVMTPGLSDITSPPPVLPIVSVSTDPVSTTVDVQTTTAPTSILGPFVHHSATMFSPVLVQPKSVSDQSQPVLLRSKPLQQPSDFSNPTVLVSTAPTVQLMQPQPITQASALASIQSIVQAPSVPSVFVQTTPVQHSIVQTTPVHQSIVQTSQVVNTIVQTPSAVHSIVKTPSVVYSNIQTPPVVHSIVQTPPIVHSIVQTPSVVHSVVQTPPVVHSIVQTPPVIHSIVHPPTGFQTLVQPPPALQSIVQSPQSLPPTPAVVQNKLAASKKSLVKADLIPIKTTNTVHRFEKLEPIDIEAKLDANNPPILVSKPKLTLVQNANSMLHHQPTVPAKKITKLIMSSPSILTSSSAFQTVANQTPVNSASIHQMQFVQQGTPTSTIKMIQTPQHSVSDTSSIKPTLNVTIAKQSDGHTTTAQSIVLGSFTPKNSSISKPTTMMPHPTPTTISMTAQPQKQLQQQKQNQQTQQQQKQLQQISQPQQQSILIQNQNNRSQSPMFVPSNLITTTTKKIIKNPQLVQQPSQQLLQQTQQNHDSNFMAPINISTQSILQPSKGITAQSQSSHSTISTPSPKPIQRTTTSATSVNTGITKGVSLLQQLNQKPIVRTTAIPPGKSLINPSVVAANISIQQQQQQKSQNLLAANVVSIQGRSAQSQSSPIVTQKVVSTTTTRTQPNTLTTAQQRQILQNIIAQQKQQRLNASNTINLVPSSVLVSTASQQQQQSQLFQNKPILVSQANTGGFVQRIIVSSAAPPTSSVIFTTSTSIPSTIMTVASSSGHATKPTTASTSSSLVNRQVIQLHAGNAGQLQSGTNASKVQTVSTSNMTPQQQHNLLQSIKQQQIRVLNQQATATPQQQTLIVKQQQVLQQIQKQLQHQQLNNSIKPGTSLLNHSSGTIISSLSTANTTPTTTTPSTQSMTRILRPGLIRQTPIVQSVTANQADSAQPTSSPVITTVQNTTGQIISLESLLQKQGHSIGSGTTLRVAGPKPGQASIIQLSGASGSTATQYAVVSQGLHGRSMISLTSTPQRLNTNPTTSSSASSSTSSSFGTTLLKPIADASVRTTATNTTDTPQSQQQLAQPKLTQHSVSSSGHTPQLVNAKVLGIQSVTSGTRIKPATSAIRMMNTSNLNITHIAGKPVIISNKSNGPPVQQRTQPQTQPHQQIARQNVIWQNAPTSGQTTTTAAAASTTTNFLIGGQTVKVHGNVVHGSADTQSTGRTSATKGAQAVMFGNQVIKLHTNTNHTAVSQSAAPQSQQPQTQKQQQQQPQKQQQQQQQQSVAQQLQQHKNANTLGNASFVSQGRTTRTVVLGQTGQTIRVHSPAQTPSTNTMQTTVIGQNIKNTIKGGQLTSVAGQQRVVLAVQGGGQILLPPGFQGGSINLKSLQGLKVIPMVQQNQPKDASNNDRPMLTQIISTPKGPRPPNPSTSGS